MVQGFTFTLTGERTNFSVARYNPHPRYEIQDRFFCEGPDLLVKHFDVLSGGFFSEGSLLSQPPAPGVPSRMDGLPPAQLFI